MLVKRPPGNINNELIYGMPVHSPLCLAIFREFSTQEQEPFWFCCLHLADLGTEQ